MRKSLTLLVGSSLAGLLAPLGIPATGASAAAQCTTPPSVLSSTVTPERVTLGVTRYKGVVVTVKIARNKACSIDRLSVDIFAPISIQSLDLDEVNSTDEAATYTGGTFLRPRQLRNADVGDWSSYITVWGPTMVGAAGPSFSVLPAARLNANATPEVVAKDGNITVAGRLTRADWETVKYRGQDSRKVELQVRTAKGSYKTLRTVAATQAGQLTSTVTATQDLCFRYAFKGSSTTAAVTSKGDCVTVK
ncbi:MAG TPA: hypothetical protein VFG99_05425 [Chloroflexia bacterium]|nr:hypothetical protein [Chloroflexia bacterium]HYP45441.1 hypothetical protein [Propionibacteriaceae bacterium]